MDEDLLVKQLAKTGNLMDVLNDAVWLREADEIEADCGGQVEAGIGLKAYAEQLNGIAPEAFQRQRHQVRILSILLPELQNWLKSWELGISFEAVYIEAQRQVYEHLNQLTPEQQTWIDALLVEDEQELPLEAKKVRSQTVAMLSSFFTKEGWQKLATVAATEMSEGVLQIAQIKNNCDRMSRTLSS